MSACGGAEESSDQSTAGTATSGGGAGGCGPSVRILASDQLAPSQIVARNGAIYWTTSGIDGDERSGVKRLSLAGGQLTTLATHQLLPGGLAVDDTDVFWANRGKTDPPGTVMTVPIDGGRIRGLAGGQKSPFAMASGGAYVYWADLNAVRRASKVEGGAEDVAVLTGIVTDVAVDASHVYLTRAQAAGMVMRIPLEGGPPEELATNQDGLTAIAIDDASVYWLARGTLEADYADGEVLAMPLAGGAPTVLATQQHLLTDVAVDGTHVYWIAVQGGLDAIVARVDKAGGPTEVLADGENNPFAIAVDDACVYWVRGDGEVRSVAK